MIFLFLPCLVLFPVFDPKVIGRKEFLFLLGVMLNLFLLKKVFKNLSINDILSGHFKNDKNIAKKINSYGRNLFISYNLLSIPTALSHEAIIFLSLPLNLVITYNLFNFTISAPKAIWRTSIVYLPTIIVSLICLFFKGNREMAIGICNSWQAYSSFYRGLKADCSSELPDVLTFFEMSFKEVLQAVWRLNIIRDQGIILLVWTMLFLFSIVLLIRGAAKILKNSLEKLKSQVSENSSVVHLSSEKLISRFSFHYLFIPFFCSLILYVMALDWGRWFFITSISYTLCLLSPTLLYLEVVNSCQNRGFIGIVPFLYSGYNNFTKNLHRNNLFKNFSVIYCLLFFYTLFLPRIPHFYIRAMDLHKGLIHQIVKLVERLPL